ncbi:SPOR domain-containing protein [Novispirillum sp. DQ9]|uniref:SPOR domain-containing protein n=1 Tax=Novispirillum sp. DQ9 TaxID=3398612 RepID=UPI003C7D4B98
MAAQRPGDPRSPQDDALYDAEDDLLDIIPQRLVGDHDDPAPASDGRGEDGLRSRSLLIGGLLVGVAVAGAAGFYMFPRESGTSGTVTPQVITAESGPYKVRPADPGGMQVPNQDKLVFERAEAGRSTEVENLLPAPQVPSAPPAYPEQPRPLAAGDMTPPPPPPLEEGEEAAMAAAPSGVAGGLPSVIPGTPVPTITAPQPAPVPPVAALPPTVPQVTPPQATIPQATVPQAVPQPVPQQVPQQVPQTVPPRTTLSPPAGAAAPAQVSATTPAAPAPAAQAPARPAPVAVATGAYMVQFAALRDDASARKLWEDLKGKHPDLLGALSPVIQKADLGAKGVFYRVRATGLSSDTAARTLCDELTKRKVGCLFVGQ